MNRFRPVILAFAFTLLASLAVSAQTGSIRGTVTDQSGAVVAGADVTARNTGTGAVRNTTTSDSGAYSINDLQAGVYELSIKKPNFKAYFVSNLQLTVAQVLSVNAMLDAGGEEQTIEVRGDKVSDIDLETSQVSNLVDQRKMIDLPLITRDPYSLVLLSPGTMQTNTSLGGFSVNGSRERNNNFLLDGSDNNDTSVPGIPDGVLAANPDSTQEFRVITNNFDAEYGRNTGAIIDLITKSGTNTFHGSAYEYGRWNGFGGARDWFNPGSGPNASPMNPYVRNQFGYSIGGPIKKGKTFFFFNQEIDRFRTAITESAIVPNAAFKSGLFTYNSGAAGDGPQTIDLRPGGAQNPGVVVTQTTNDRALPTDPTMQNIFALYPNPTINNGDGFSGTVFFPTDSKQNVYNQIVKIDHHFTDSETFSATYGYGHSTDPDPFHDDVLPGGVGSTATKAINEALSANLNSVLSPTLVNNFRFGWNHIYAAFTCNHSELDSVSPLDQFGKGRDYIMDPFTSFGCLDLDGANGQDRKTGTVSYNESLSWVRGAHTFKFGVEFRSIGEGGNSNFFSRRQLSTDTTALFGVAVMDDSAISNPSVQLEDAASAYYGFVAEDQAAEFFNKAGDRVGSDDKLFRQHEYDGYMQDSWKIRHNLTLDFGLRYQFDGVPYEENGNFSNLLTNPGSFTAGQAVTFSLVGPGTGNQLYQNDFSGIEPRLGFSWDPWGDGKTAVRAGFGIFHDRAFGNLFGNARSNPPFEQDYVAFPFDTLGNTFSGTVNPGVPSVAPTQIPNPIVLDGSHLSPVLFDNHFRNPSSNNWNFDIQRAVAPGTTLDVAYIGSKGTHIFREMDGNPPDPNLVNQLLAFCADPNNSFGCSADTVTKGNLFEGADFGALPFNAIANNAMVEPFYIRSVGNSNYNSLQVKVTRQMSHGLELQGSYTWAHAIDDSGDPIVPGAGNRGFPRNSRDLSEERGNSDDDIRHVAVINYIWQVPFGKGRSYWNHGAMGRVLEGFQFSGITSLQSGIPFDVYSTTDMERTGLSGRADLVGNPFAPGNNPNADAGKVFFTNTAAFFNRGDGPGGLTGGPLFEGPGTIGRNHFHGPNYINFNLSLAKQMAITERVGIEIRCEAYNIFNHPEFTNPGSDPGALGNQLNSPLFGIITSTRTQPDGTTSARQLQMALRLTF
jgi:hypothetical protein